MAVSTTDVVAPVFAAAEVVVFLSTGMARQASFRGFLRTLVFEGNDLFRIAFLDVRLAWTMARLATCHLVFPATGLRELCVGSVRKSFELIFVTVFAGVAADVVTGLRLVHRDFSWPNRCRLGGICATKPTDHGEHHATDQECFDESTHSTALP